MKPITVSAVLVLCSSLLFENPALALDSPPGGLDLEHCALGGDIIDQPEGSPLNFCCYDDGCWQCDVNWQNCIWEPAMLKKPGTFPGRHKVPGTSIEPGQMQRIER